MMAFGYAFTRTSGTFHKNPASTIKSISELRKLSTYPLTANSVLLIYRVGIPFSLAISKTPAVGTLHTIRETLIGRPDLEFVPSVAAENSLTY